MEFSSKRWGGLGPGAKGVALGASAGCDGGMLRASLLVSSMGLFSLVLTGCQRAPESPQAVAPEAPAPGSVGKEIKKMAAGGASPEEPAGSGTRAGTAAKPPGAALEVPASNEGLWTSNWKQAKAKAAETQRDLLINFTGSDWCRYCMALNREVFETQAFKEEIGRSFVPMVVDFPMEESRISPAVASQNSELQAQFGVKVYPSIFLADATGKPYAQTGYREGGAEAYLKHLSELREVRARRDAAFQKAEPLSGLEKAAALKEGLEAVGEPLVLGFYRETLQRIGELDPKDSLGVDAKFGFQEAFEELLKVLQKRRSEGAAVLVSVGEEFLKKRASASAEHKQLVWMGILNYLTPPRDNEAALKILGRIRDLGPESENGKIAGENFERLKKSMEESKAVEGKGGPVGAGTPAGSDSGSGGGK